MASLVATVDLPLAGKTLKLRESQRAVYRLHNAGLRADLLDLWEENRRFAALCNWLWACDTGGAFATPEEVADVTAIDDVGRLMDGLLAMHRTAYPASAPATPAEVEKKSTLTAEPPPASNSG